MANPSQDLAGQDQPRGREVGHGVEQEDADLRRADARLEGGQEELRSFEHGSSGSTADMAVEGRPSPEDRDVDAPFARPADPDDPQLDDALAGKAAAPARNSNPDGD